MYSYYFNLQRKRFERGVQEIGLSLWLAYVSIPLIYIVFVKLLFIKTSFAPGILTALGVFYPLKLSEEKRTDFLKSLYADHFSTIRLLENIIISIPVIIALLIKLKFVYAIVLLAIVTILSFWQAKSYSNAAYIKIFSKNPFEFTSGIRLTSPLFLLAYFLCGMGLYVANYNLSAFSLALIFFMTLIFYSNQEVKYFIWIFNKSVHDFIMYKFITGTKYVLISSSPMIISICWVTPGYWYILAIIIICGLANLLNIIIIRYAIYPKEYGLLDSLAIVFCIMMPPLVLVTIPHYYKKLNTSIKPLLS